MPEGGVDVLLSRLGRVRGTIRSLFLLDGASRTALALSIFVAASFALDWLFILPPGARLVILFAGLAGVAWIVARRLVYPMGVPITDDDLAVFVERHYPELKDRLISAIQLSREAGAAEGTIGFNSPQLVRRLIDDAVAATGALDFGQVVIRAHVMRIAAAAGILLLVLAGSAAARPDLAKIYASRAFGGAAKWPRRTTLVVLDFDAQSRVRTFAKGDDITIAVRADGTDPGKVRIRYTFAGESESDDTMTRMGDRYQRQFPHVAGPFTFHVLGGDDETDVFEIRIQNPPSIKDSLNAFFEYPEYLDLQNTPSDRPEASGNIQAPLGTRVRLEAEATEDLLGAKLIVGVKGKEKTVDMALAKDAQGRPRKISGGFAVDETYSEYQIQLTATNSLLNRDPIRYTIKGIADQKPAIQVFEPAGDENVTEVCKRPLHVVVTDDYGVAAIGVEVRIAGSRTTDWMATAFGPDQNRPREYNRSGKRVQSDYVLDLKPLGVKEGDFVELRFAARDFRAPEANTTLSRVYRFGVVSITALETELQQAIEKIKQGLVVQQGRQRVALDRTGNVEKKFAAVEKLGPEQQGEVRGLAFEQQGIAEKLDQARKDIERVRLRGVWNSVFDERAAKALENASAELELLTGSPVDPNQAGAARLASTLVVTASRAAARERLPLFGQIQNLQGQTLDGIAKALRYLDNWSTYQQIVSMVRQAKEALEKGKTEMLK